MVKQHNEGKTLPAFLQDFSFLGQKSLGMVIGLNGCEFELSELLKHYFLLLLFLIAFIAWGMQQAASAFSVPIKKQWVANRLQLHYNKDGVLKRVQAIEMA